MKKPILLKSYRSFPHRVFKWAIKVFNERIVISMNERNKRFLEESLELVQALDLPETDAMAILSHVYSRPAGVIHQELGGVMVTLNILCQVASLDAQECGEIEYERISKPETIAKIRIKQNEKAAIGIGGSI